MYAYTTSIWKAKAKRFHVQGHLGLYSKTVSQKQDQELYE